MTVELPNWLLCLIALGVMVWIMAGVIVAKTADIIRRTYGGGTHLRFRMPPPNQPPQNPYDDADWWKKG